MAPGPCQRMGRTRMVTCGRIWRSVVRSTRPRLMDCGIASRTLNVCRDCWSDRDSRWRCEWLAACLSSVGSLLCATFADGRQDHVHIYVWNQDFGFWKVSVMYWRIQQGAGLDPAVPSETEHIWQAVDQQANHDCGPYMALRCRKISRGGTR